MLHCCCFNRCHCTAGATFVFMRQCLLFAPAECCVTYSCAASLPLDVVAPLTAPLPSICPVVFCVASHCAATTMRLNQFLTCSLIVVLPLIAPPSHLSRVIVASPLVALPPPLNAPLPHLVLVPQPPICLLLRMPHLPPAGFFLDARHQRMSGQRWEHCFVFGRLVCCEQPPLSCHQKWSHKLIMCL
jgi:hypothetical protein